MSEAKNELKNVQVNAKAPGLSLSSAGFVIAGPASWVPTGGVPAVPILGAFCAGAAGGTWSPAPGFGGFCWAIRLLFSTRALLLSGINAGCALKIPQWILQSHNLRWILILHLAGLNFEDHLMLCGAVHIYTTFLSRFFSHNFQVLQLGPALGHFSFSNFFKLLATNWKNTKIRLESDNLSIYGNYRLVFY